MKLPVNCFKCKHAWELAPPFGRSEECPKCMTDFHVCRNCQFFDSSAHHSCREPQAEHVKEKEQRNFCDEFRPIPLKFNHDPQQANLTKLQSLFSNSKEPQNNSSKKNDLEDSIGSFLQSKKNRNPFD